MLSAKYIHINMDKNKRPKLYTLPDALRTPSSARRRLDLPGAACCGRSALHPVRLALCSQSWCAGGWGLHRRGIQGAPGVGQVMPAIKFFKEKGVFLDSSRQHPPHLHKTKPI